MQSFLLLFAGALSGPIFDRGYFQSLLRIGSSLITLGMLMTSFCSKYWQVMLAQGMCVGLGAACVYIPCMAIIAQYFDRKKALATGLATSGGSFGIFNPFIYPAAVANTEYYFRRRNISSTISKLGAENWIPVDSTNHLPYRFSYTVYFSFDDEIEGPAHRKEKVV